METVAKITETEWEIMRAVWTQHPATASEIIDRLAAADPSWHPKTVRTLLSRLVRKQVLGYEAQGRAYVYRPLVTEKDCAAAASDSFLDRVFGGALKPMLAHFVEQRKLTKEDLRELRELLDGKDEKRAGKRRSS